MVATERNKPVRYVSAICLAACLVAATTSGTPAQESSSSDLGGTLSTLESDSGPSLQDTVDFLQRFLVVNGTNNSDKLTAGSVTKWYTCRTTGVTTLSIAGETYVRIKSKCADSTQYPTGSGTMTSDETDTARLSTLSTETAPETDTVFKTMGLRLGCTSGSCWHREITRTFSGNLTWSDPPTVDDTVESILVSINTTDSATRAGKAFAHLIVLGGGKAQTDPF